MKVEDVKTFAAGLDTPDLQKLQTKHKELLDTIDKLRDHDIGKYVELPQIIVVGDQSSGKSSVLESISRVRFPSKHELCTRFATELVLREADETWMEVTIKPHESESEEVKKRLSEFNRKQTELSELSSIVKEATEHMGIDGRSNPFSRHVLCIKISGPEVPQLTLVDLPGFYHSSGVNQPAEYRMVVHELAAEYMKQKGSIILAVISAGVSSVLQTILDETKKYDEHGQRTLGIITKPDRVERGEEGPFLELLANVKNSPHYLKHGWHVLRNRAGGDTVDFDDRDQTEAELLCSRPWSDIPTRNKGIATLRERLSKMLLTHIAEKLPNVTTRIEQLIHDRQRSLMALGDPRETSAQCMRHLNGIAKNFARLAEQAVGGGDKDSCFFGEISPGPEPNAIDGRRNLRGHVRNLNRAFIAVFLKCGSKRVIQWRDPRDEVDWVRTNIPHELTDLAACYDAADPDYVSQQEYEQLIANYATKCQGTEFPGVYPSKWAMVFFEDQAKPWQGLATRHVELAVEASEFLIKDILQHVTQGDDDIRDKIMKTFIDPFFKDRKVMLLEKLQEILPHFPDTGFPLAMEQVFEIRVKQRLDDRFARQFLVMKENTSVQPFSEQFEGALENKSFARNAINSWSGTPQEWGIETVLDYMVVYYGVSSSLSLCCQAYGQI